MILIVCRVPNAVDGHDSPEVEIYGMDGVPQEDIQRHYDGLPIIPYTKGKLIIGDSSILPILAAQKASVAMQLAESKNMTVQGDVIIGSGVTQPQTQGPVIGGSSAMSVVSPPLPSSNVSVSVSAPIQPSYWPYMMPQYYQQAPTSTANPSDMYAASYAQYYQAYYAAQAASSYQNVEPAPAAPVSTAPNSDEPLVIPPYVDPNTNKSVPGTIFTVQSLDRSLEELRSELKKYKK